MTVAYGLDFAGYSSGKTGLARAQIVAPDQVELTVYRGHPFARKWPGSTPLREVVQAERDLLGTCARCGPVMIDLPLDLDQLPRPSDPIYIWELTLRPVDYALEAMPPLANLIGAPVARLLNMLRGLPADWVGTRLFETYPAVSLEFLGLHGRGYKSGSGVVIRYEAGVWRGTGPAERLAANANQLGWQAEDGLVLNDDEFDAALCALTGMAGEVYQLRGAALDTEITRRIQAKIPSTADRHFQAPPSFVLLEQLPPWSVTVTVCAADDASVQISP